MLNELLLFPDTPAVVDKELRPFEEGNELVVVAVIVAVRGGLGSPVTIHVEETRFVSISARLLDYTMPHIAG